MDRQYTTLLNNNKALTLIPAFMVCIVTACLMVVAMKKPELTATVEALPNYYEESSYDYENYVAPSDSQIYEAGSTYSSVTIENFQSTETFESVVTNISASNKELILLSDSDAWKLVSNGVFDSYPTQPYAQIKEQVKQVYNENMCMITVRCWYWSNPDDETDMNKTTVTKKFAVNKAVSQLFIDIFNDIYDDPTKPVINVADAGMGTWVLRGKNHSDKNTLSGHSMGTTIDINPSTGSFLINGTWYGNGYGHKDMPKSVWDQLPECHKKYHVLYIDCPIVQIFKSYGFYWGGDWKSGTDCMHLSFLGDGSNGRIKGQANYYVYS